MSTLQPRHQHACDRPNTLDLRKTFPSAWAHRVLRQIVCGLAQARNRKGLALWGGHTAIWGPYETWRSAEVTSSVE